MFKIGDKVRVIKVDNVDIQRGIKVGDVFEVGDVLHIGIITKDHNYLLRNDQVELFTDTKFKKGDKVRLVRIDMSDVAHGFVLGDVYTVESDDDDGTLLIGSGTNWWYVENDQVELITDTKPSKDEQLLQQLFDLAHEVVVLESQDSVTWEEVKQLEGYKHQIMQLVLGMVRND